jgi:hypothetical protein
MDQKPFYDIGYDHGIIVGIILERKVLLRKFDRHMRPFRLDVESLYSDLLYPFCASFFYFLLAGSKLEPHVIRSMSFVAKGDAA